VTQVRAQLFSNRFTGDEWHNGYTFRWPKSTGYL
jgi:hypothetical protein